MSHEDVSDTSEDESQSAFEETDTNSEDQAFEERLKDRQQNGILRCKKLKKSTQRNHKTKSKRHAPKEVSSRRSDYFRRGVPLLANSGIATEASISTNRFKARDPRMECLNGHFDQGAFDHKFAFLEKVCISLSHKLLKISLMFLLI